LVPLSHSGLLYVLNKSREEGRAGEGRPPAIGKRRRDLQWGYPWPRRAISVWRLDESSLAALKALMPDGLLGEGWIRRAAIEDLCVYRNGELLLWTISHEHEAEVELSDAEWHHWTLWSESRLS
jgi:hypothetical protein